MFSQCMFSQVLYKWSPSLYTFKPGHQIQIVMPWVECFWRQSASTISLSFWGLWLMWRSTQTGVQIQPCPMSPVKCRCSHNSCFLYCCTSPGQIFSLKVTALLQVRLNSTVPIFTVWLPRLPFYTDFSPLGTATTPLLIHKSSGK